MNKAKLKKKTKMFLLILVFMAVYVVVFGRKNMGVGMMMALAILMNLKRDLSYKPKLSFIKILCLLLTLGVAAFLNYPITIWGCILTFFIVFWVTFTSYHLFSKSVYFPYLMCYFIMMCVPVPIEDFPLRLIGLVFGAIFIVGINLVVNRKKDDDLSKSTISKLISEIISAVDIKLDGGEVSMESFQVTNDYYNHVFSRSGYSYFPFHNQKSVLNIVNAFRQIGRILSENEFSTDELNYVKSILNDISNINSSEIFEGIDVTTEQFNLILLNIEIIVYEIENKDMTRESVIQNRNAMSILFGPMTRKKFSFKSPKFTFAFKMAFVLTLWEILTLIFNLPFTKWLYFASIPLMMPYVEDVAYTARSRVIGTAGGILAFTLFIIAIPYIPIPTTLLVISIFVICIFGMVYKMDDKLQMTIFTSVMSVMTSLMYIELPQAITLKILWVVVAVIVVSIINFGFLPYSVEKETEINLDVSFKINQRSINLIKSKAKGEEAGTNIILMAVSNIIGENIELDDENKRLYQLQIEIMDISNFIINYMNIHELSQDTKEKIVAIIEDNETFNDFDGVSDRMVLYSTQYLIKLFNEEKMLMNNLN